MPSEKQKIIDEMLKMQEEFIRREKSGEIDAQDYWSEDEDHPAQAYKEEYDRLASKLVDLAHQEKGSIR